MLIDGLIKFCDEKSKNIKLKAEPQVFIEIKQALEELKIYKECNISKTNFVNGYNKAIDEFAETLKGNLVRKYANANLTQQYVALQVTDWCNEIAEQMKAGGING